MNTKIRGFDGFQKSLHPSALDKSSLSIRRVNEGGGGGGGGGGSVTIFDFLPHLLQVNNESAYLLVT